MKTFKRILSVISVCAILCALSGCNRVVRVADAINWEIQAKQIANEQAEIILDCLKTGNSEKLEALFCKNVSSSHDLKTEIAEAIEFIDGNIIDDGSWFGLSSADKSVDNGKTTKLNIRPGMHKVKTDTGKEYNIRFVNYLIYEEDPDNVGITYITIRKGNDSITVGGL